MTPGVKVKDALFPGCQHRPDDPCYFFLPRRSRLGTFEHPRRLPTGEWPLTFLCLRHERSSVCSLANIRPEAEMLTQGRPILPMWWIEVVCAHESCGRSQSIYAGGTSDWQAIVGRILETEPQVPCGDHYLVWREELIRHEMLPHDPPEL